MRKKTVSPNNGDVLHSISTRSQFLVELFSSEHLEDRKQVQTITSTLISRIESLWTILHIPRDEIKFYQDNIFKSSFDRLLLCKELASYFRGLLQHKQRTLLVLQGIREREIILSECLDCLAALQRKFFSRRDKSLDSLFHSKKFESTNAINLSLFWQEELLSLLKSLQIHTVEVVRRIQWWRQGLWRPRCFIWEGQNYLLKIESDLNCLSTSSFQRLLREIPLYPEKGELLCLLFSSYLPDPCLTPDPTSASPSSQSPSSHLRDNFFDSSFYSYSNQCSSNLWFRDLSSVDSAVRAERGLQRDISREEASLKKRGVFVPTLKPLRVWKQSTSLSDPNPPFSLKSSSQSSSSVVVPSFTPLTPSSYLFELNQAQESSSSASTDAWSANQQSVEADWQRGGGIGGIRGGLEVSQIPPPDVLIEELRSQQLYSLQQHHQAQLDQQQSLYQRKIHEIQSQHQTQLESYRERLSQLQLQLQVQVQVQANQSQKNEKPDREKTRKEREKEIQDILRRRELLKEKNEGEEREERWRKEDELNRLSFPPTHSPPVSISTQFNEREKEEQLIPQSLSQDSVSSSSPHNLNPLPNPPEDPPDDPHPFPQSSPPPLDPIPLYSDIREDRPTLQHPPSSFNLESLPLSPSPSPRDLLNTTSPSSIISQPSQNPSPSPSPSHIPLSPSEQLVSQVQALAQRLVWELLEKEEEKEKEESLLLFGDRSLTLTEGNRDNSKMEREKEGQGEGDGEYLDDTFISED